MVKAREIDAPDVFVFWRKRAVVRFGQLFHPFPGKCQLHRPAAVAVLVVVDGSIHVDGWFSGEDIDEPGRARNSLPGVLVQAAVDFDFFPSPVGGVMSHFRLGTRVLGLFGALGVGCLHRGGLAGERKGEERHEE